MPEGWRGGAPRIIDVPRLCQVGGGSGCIIGLHGGEARWRIISEPDGAVLDELRLVPVPGAAEATFGRPGAPTRLRMLVVPGDGPPPALRGLSFAPAHAAPAAGCVFPAEEPAPAR